MRKILPLAISMLLLAASCGGTSGDGPAMSGSAGSGDTGSTTSDSDTGSTTSDSDTGSTTSDSDTGSTTSDSDTGSTTSDSDTGSTTSDSDTGSTTSDSDTGSTTSDSDTGSTTSDSDTGSTTSNGDTGNSDTGGDTIDLQPGDVTLTAGLVRFDGCDALLDYLRVEYSARVGAWGFGDGPWNAPVFDEADTPEMAASEQPAAGAGAGNDDSAAGPVEGADFSGTNVQEAGVDEADIIKTDGRRIFTLSAGRLVVVDAAGRSKLGEVTITEGWGRELFIDGDHLLLITRTSTDAGDGNETVLERIDVGGDTPRIVETINTQGSYLSARSVDGTARVILHFDNHRNFPFVFPQNDSAAEQAERINREAVLNSSLDDWLPHHTIGEADSSTGALLTPCENVHAPSLFSGFGVTTVISVPIGGDFDPAASTAVLAPGDTVYASPESLYVATARWLTDDESDSDNQREAWRQRRTNIHRFDITGTEAAYAASGEVLGVIHNQFSMSEHSGHLRVVTTVSSGPWGDDSESWVRVLDITTEPLAEVGSVGDIGRGEDVQSVRFVGDVGYVVTFRQIDPFYTLDLSDPTDPRVVGELKIPGFSSYLHPISDSLVIGVGSEAGSDGVVTGSKVSLFDVSDLTAPLEVDVWSVPDGWHTVGWDHRAFLWWQPESLAVIPVAVWSDGSVWSGAVVLRVADGTITEVGRVENETEGDEEPGRTACRRITEADLESATSGRSSDENPGSTGVDAIDAIDTLGSIISDLYGAIIACEPGQSGMTGFDCIDAAFYTDAARELGLISGDETVSTCWPAYSPYLIVRSMVIGDDLWTLSLREGGSWDGEENPSRLYVNDLATLQRLAALQL